ncbi:MAG: response regulator transcription factor [Bacteroidetes bacterium]|nr:response regulator transcription factor [Bacteroidota bacterium]
MKIILIDDHQLFLDGLGLILDSIEGVELLEKYTSPEQAIRLIEVLKPDVVFSDLDMPKLTGKQVAEHIKRVHPEIKVVILSMHVDPTIIKGLLDIGVDGYLLKTDDIEDFEHAVKLLSKDKKAFSPAVTDLLNSGKTNSIGAGTSFGNEHDLSMLSNREKEVLTAVAQGLSTKALSDKLCISPGTAETHRKNIMRKLDANNVADLVRIAVKAGLV